MKKIKLTKGKVAIVDNEDYERLSAYKWSAIKSRNYWYAISGIRHPKKTTVYMHRIILNVYDPKIRVDHADCNGLNNQKFNLRVCSTSQNAANARKRKNCSSIYKGVSFSKQSGRWFAGITFKGKKYFLGQHINEIDAAKAYNSKALELQPNFAKINSFNAKTIKP